MKLMKYLLAAVLFALMISPTAAQENHEVSSEVKELSDYHDVIYKLWHTAWPEKNTAMLKEILPDVKSGFEKIRKAELPGILRDKKEKWNEGVKKLAACVDEYEKASESENAENLLKAAETLHSTYEGLVRVIRPVLKEVDAFHQDLYILYHYYVPEYSYDKVKSVINDMTAKMDDLNKAELPKRMSAKAEKFDAARKNLYDAFSKFVSIVNAGDNKKDITAALDAMHSRYEELEKVFE